MSGFLHVVERAYQGTLEEQDDQALWLVGALGKTGLEQQVLLRGPAVSYALPDQGVGQLHIGGVQSGHPPRLDRDVQHLIGEGVSVFLVREDAENRGIAESDTLPEVRWVDRDATVGLFRGADRILAW